MLDMNTFLTLLYVSVDDFDKAVLPPIAPTPGPDPAVTRAEVITLAVAGQWSHFKTERRYYAWAERHLRSYFPTLPHRSQYNRQLRRHQAALEQFFAYLAARLDAHLSAYEAVDGTAMPVRNYKRRGLSHLAGLADLGRGHRVSWFYGFHLLLACSAAGVITGYGIAAASTKDQPLLDSFLALRHQPNARLLTTGKPAATGVYVADKGFEGGANQQRWRSDYRAEVIVPPRRTSRRPWSSEERKWFAGVRQMVETVFGKLHGEFGLEDERPHEMSGLGARLAAKVGLHNFCIWLNRQLGRADLAFADLVAW